MLWRCQKKIYKKFSKIKKSRLKKQPIFYSLVFVFYHDVFILTEPYIVSILNIYTKNIYTTNIYEKYKNLLSTSVKKLVNFEKCQ